MPEPVFGNYCGRCRRSRTDCICASIVHSKPVPASQEPLDKIGISRFKKVGKTKIDRQAILDKFGCKCAYCGEAITLKTMQVDHVIPQSDMEHNRKGEEFKNKERIPKFLRHLTPYDINHLDNLFPACRVCNKWKNSFSLEEFREEIMLQPERMKRDSPQFRMALKYELIEVAKVPDIEFHFEWCLKWKGVIQDG